MRVAKKLKKELKNNKEVERDFGNNEFYNACLTDKFKEQFSKLTKNQKKIAILGTKKAIDNIYYKERVEDKYIYLLNLIALHENLCTYLDIHNKYYDTKPEYKELYKKDKELFIRHLGYEPAFSKSILKKASEIATRLFNLIERYKELYYMGLRDKERVNTLKNNFITFINKQPKKIINYEEEFKNEIEIISDTYNQIKYGRDNFDVITCGTKETDIKTIKLLKDVYTRLENLFNIISSDIELAA